MFFEMSGSYVNLICIALLVDVITNRGSLMSLDRHGIKRIEDLSQNVPLKKHLILYRRRLHIWRIQIKLNLYLQILCWDKKFLGTGAVDIDI